MMRTSHGCGMLVPFSPAQLAQFVASLAPCPSTQLVIKSGGGGREACGGSGRDSSHGAHGAPHEGSGGGAPSLRVMQPLLPARGCGSCRR